jgi:Ca2+-binding RTX toxin-like protein
VAINLGTTNASNNSQTLNGARATFTNGGANDGTNTVRGFETVPGSNNNNDLNFARAGNETLEGNGGGDIISGGAGADTLRSGAGNDTFVYTNATDSGANRATQDRIMDFTQGQDKIDLRDLDANTRARGAQHVINLTDNGFRRRRRRIALHLAGPDDRPERQQRRRRPASRSPSTARST